MKCPHCSTSLVMTDRQGIEIDYCPDCRGVWLDRGELDKIIERTEKEYSKPRNNDRYDDDRYDDDDDSPAFGMMRKGQPKKKKKMGGMLGDLFEF